MFKAFKSIFGSIQFPFAIILFQLLLIYLALLLPATNGSVIQPVSKVLLAFAGFGCLCSIAGWAGRVVKKVEALEAKVNELTGQNNP